MRRVRRRPSSAGSAVPASDLGAAWEALPPNVWVALHRTQPSIPSFDGPARFYAEIGHKGDWRTGPAYGEDPAQALRNACKIARSIIDSRGSVD